MKNEYNTPSAADGKVLFSSMSAQSFRRMESKVLRPEAKPVNIHDSFRAVSLIWKQLPEKIKRTWKDTDSGITMNGYGLFMSTNTQRHFQGRQLSISRGSGISMLQGLKASSGVSGGILLAFAEQKTPPFISVIVQKVSCGNRPEIKAFYDIKSGRSSAAVKGLERGAEYIVYCIATNDLFEKSKAVSASCGFRIKTE